MVTSFGLFICTFSLCSPLVGPAATWAWPGNRLPDRQTPSISLDGDAAPANAQLGTEIKPADWTEKELD